jgi:opacity protein-like surface antigen
MTRRTTLFFVCAFEIALLLFVAAWSALADTENSNSWFIEGRYQVSLYEGTGWSSSEYDTPGSTSTQIQSATSESRDKLNSAGFAVGYLMNGGNTSIGLAYENFGSSVWKTGQFTAKDGRVFDSSEYPMTMRNFMIEVTHTYPLEEDRFALALAGIGQAVIKTSGFAKTLSSTRVAGQIHDRQVENFSVRLGGGMGVNLTQSLQLIGILQYSNYGQSETVGHYAGNNGVRDYDMGIFKTDANAVEASIRLRYHF